MDLVAILGKNVRSFRVQQGLSQENLALDAGMKRSYLSDLERGVRNPTVKALGRLAAALGVRPAQLLEGPTDPAAPPGDAVNTAA